MSKTLLRKGTILQHDDSDNVQVLHETDLLIESEIIAEIGRDLHITEDVSIIDCRGKIICPGFVDTHHHCWQTQLKGRHSDDSLLDYHPKGNLQFYNYTAEDIFWGELGGLLESIDGGTTCVVDHAHMSMTPDHVTAGYEATVASGIRSVFCYSFVPRIAHWGAQFELEKQQVAEWYFPQLESLAKRAASSAGKISMGFGFDSYGMPEAEIVEMFTAARKLGAKIVTSHLRRNNIGGMGTSIAELQQNLGILGPDVIFSHGTGMSKAEFDIIKHSGAQISTTPATESQMAHGEIVCFRDDVNGSLGSDCHSNNPGSILHAMQIGLAVARSHHNERMIAGGKFPLLIKPTTLQAFNLATIRGARAIGMGNSIGSLREGKQADIAIFRTDSPSMVCATEHDPLVAVVRHASHHEVDTVIVAGQVLKQEGKLIDVIVNALTQWRGALEVRAKASDGRLDWSTVMRELRRSSADIRPRIDKCAVEGARKAVIQIWGGHDDVLT